MYTNFMSTKVNLSLEEISWDMYNAKNYEIYCISGTVYTKINLEVALHVLIIALTRRGLHTGIENCARVCSAISWINLVSI